MAKEQWQIDFYHSKQWAKIRKIVLNRDMGLCRNCIKRNVYAVADLVHHIKPLDKYPELGLDIDNLVSLCSRCHEREHDRRAKKSSKQQSGVRIIKM